MHQGVMITGLGDGSVRAVAATINIVTFQRLCHPRDGEVLGSDWQE
jgi:hypothetical protein